MFSVTLRATSLLPRNTISNNNQTGVGSFLAEGMLIYGNTLSSNGNGVQLTESSDNTVYGNNFINNTSQATCKNEPNWGWSIANWHDGRLGNFWSDYNGTDANHDGIGDKPYVIDEKNTDQYPLMKQVNISAAVLPTPTPLPAAYAGEIPLETTAVVLAVSAIIIGAGLILYFKKCVHTKK